MILVSLGTQDRSFKRLLDAVEKQIKLGNIKEKVIVQAGETFYQSDVMEIFDLIPSEEFLKLLDECSVLITHGGVGTIIDGLKHHKKIIAAARLEEYGEHKNNHQKQIIQEFVKKHYILELEDFDKLDEKLEQIKDFVPDEYESNTNNFIANLDSYIEINSKNNMIYQKFMLYSFFGIVAVLLEFLCLIIFDRIGLNILTNLCIFHLILILYRFIMQYIFFKDMKKTFRGELFFLGVLVIQILLVFYFPNSFLDYFIWKMLGLSLLSILLVFILSLVFHVEE